jgi:hypothetical protein
MVATTAKMAKMVVAVVIVTIVMAVLEVVVTVREPGVEVAPVAVVIVGATTHRHPQHQLRSWAWRVFGSIR